MRREDTKTSMEDRHMLRGRKKSLGGRKPRTPGVGKPSMLRGVCLEERQKTNSENLANLRPLHSCGL